MQPKHVDEDVDCASNRASLRLHSSSLAALIIGTILAVAVGAQDRRFKTEISLVEVDVVVRDSNRQPVTGLTTADFTVFEGDVRQSITSFAEIEPGL
jgi:rRNA maturation protein Rpf1